MTFRLIRSVLLGQTLGSLEFHFLIIFKTFVTDCMAIKDIYNFKLLESFLTRTGLRMPLIQNEQQIKLS